MGRRAAVLFLFAGALLLTPGAPGGPDVPGDPTPPNVVPVITGTLGSNGWYTTNVGVSWSITDPESIILSTSGCDTASLPGDTTGITLVCSAESDGGVTTITKVFKIDKTAPVSSATAARSADSNGWYNHSLDVSFNGSDATSGLDSCSPPATYAGPDNGNASVSGTCKDKAGNIATPSLSLKYDSTKPQASPSARATDKNGWYNHSVTVNYQGADATSGIDSCTQTTYSGPDDPSTAVGGTCTDKAGKSERLEPLHAQVRRDRATGERDCFARPRRQRLVQPRSDRQLQRKRRDFGVGHLRRPCDVLGPGLDKRRRFGHLPRLRRQHDHAFARAEVRRDRTPGDGYAGPPAERKGLVQGGRHSHIRRNRRDLRAWRPASRRRTTRGPIARTLP